MLDDLRHAYVDLDDPTYLEFRYTQLLGDVVDGAWPAGEPIDAVHLGGGGFTIPRYLAATRPGSDSLVLELDPGVVELAEDELGLVPSDRAAGASPATPGSTCATSPDDSADLVVGDAFGGRAVPWHLTTTEFVRGHPAGAARRRDLRPERHRPATARTSSTPTWPRCASVFAHVAVLGPPGRFDGSGAATRSSSPATRRSRSPRSSPRNAARGDDDELVDDPAAIDDFIGDAPVLTDEHAPVDQLLT